MKKETNHLTMHDMFFIAILLKVASFEGAGIVIICCWTSSASHSTRKGCLSIAQQECGFPKGGSMTGLL